MNHARGGGATLVCVCVCVGPLGEKMGKDEPLQCALTRTTKKRGNPSLLPEKTMRIVPARTNRVLPKKRRTTVAVCPSLPTPPHMRISNIGHVLRPPPQPPPRPFPPPLQARSPAHLAQAINSTALRAGWHAMGAAVWANQAVHSRTTHDHVYGRAPMDVQGPGAEARFAEHVFASQLWQEMALGIAAHGEPGAGNHGAQQHHVQHQHHGQPHHQQQLHQHPAGRRPPRVSQQALAQWSSLGRVQRFALMQRADVTRGLGWLPGQRDATEAILDAVALQHHAMVVLPCGAGKSMALARACTAASLCSLLITPTVASRDQWLADDTRPDAAAHHATRMGLAEWARLAWRVRTEGMLLVGTPEDVTAPGVRTALRSSSGSVVDVVAVDEAHLWLSWPSFRPRLRQAMEVARHMGHHGRGVPIVGLTGTLPVAQEQAIYTALAMDGGRQVRIHRRACVRTNVTMRVQRLQRRAQLGPWLARACAHMRIGEHHGPPVAQQRLGMVFVGVVDDVHHVVAELDEQGVAAAGYHGRMAEADKRAALQRWGRGPCSVMVCTMALAVAVHRRGVVLVVDVPHARHQQDVLDLAQKMGRIDGGEQMNGHVRMVGGGNWVEGSARLVPTTQFCCHTRTRTSQKIREPHMCVGAAAKKKDASSRSRALPLAPHLQTLASLCASLGLVASRIGRTGRGRDRAGVNGWQRSWMER